MFGEYRQLFGGAGFKGGLGARCGAGVTVCLYPDRRSIRGTTKMRDREELLESPRAGEGAAMQGAVQGGPWWQHRRVLGHSPRADTGLRGSRR